MKFCNLTLTLKLLGLIKNRFIIDNEFYMQRIQHAILKCERV